MEHVAAMIAVLVRVPAAPEIPIADDLPTLDTLSSEARVDYFEDQQRRLQDLEDLHMVTRDDGWWVRTVRGNAFVNGAHTEDRFRALASQPSP